MRRYKRKMIASAIAMAAVMKISQLHDLTSHVILYDKQNSLIEPMTSKAIVAPWLSVS